MGSGAGVARRADIIITMVPDTKDVEAALFGKNGVAEGLSKGKIVVDMSSISPIATKDFARHVKQGCVSGGEVGGKAATLTIMFGGSQATFEKVKPICSLMGESITLIGGNSGGQTAKVANQIILQVARLSSLNFTSIMVCLRVLAVPQGEFMTLFPQLSHLLFSPRHMRGLSRFG